MIGPFAIARLPRIEFGVGAFTKIPALATGYGRRVLLVTGKGAVQRSPQWTALLADFEQWRVVWNQASVWTEPSPEFIDQVVREHAGGAYDAVIGVGGGSALDAAKAIAGLLRVGRSVMDYLEGVGPELPYEGPAVPFIAVPTTAGTGSEATKNAVLSVQGKDGFKKSFRHDKLVAEYAVVDPELLRSCPPELIAANGMDALTQLVESYVSTKANAFTDALALSGLRAARDGLLDWYEGGPAATEAQARMAYAALLSGITLAQVGLGSVHGLASPLGAFFPLPHGVVCGTLLASATRVNIQALSGREPENPALVRYAQLAELLCNRSFSSPKIAREALVDLLEQWTERLALPRLARYGVTAAHLGHIVANARGSSMKTNPVVLTDDEIRQVVEARL